MSAKASMNTLNVKWRRPVRLSADQVAVVAWEAFSSVQSLSRVRLFVIP